MMVNLINLGLCDELRNSRACIEPDFGVFVLIGSIDKIGLLN